MVGVVERGARTQLELARVEIGRRSGIRRSFGGREGALPGEFHDNPVLLLWLSNLNRVNVQPPEARARALASLARNQSWVGAHVMILSSHYRIELPYLVSAIERYIAEPQARQGSAVPRLPVSR